MTNELKICPFCGDSDVFVDWNYYEEVKKDLYFIRCRFCQRVNCWSENEQHTINLWNGARVYEVETAELQTKLEKAAAENAHYHTWQGLMELVNEHYPADVFLDREITETDFKDVTNVGAVVITLLRHLEGLKNILQFSDQTKLAKAEAENARLKEELRLYQLKEAYQKLSKAYSYLLHIEIETNHRVLLENEEEENEALDILDNLQKSVNVEIKELEKEIEGK